MRRFYSPPLPNTSPSVGEILVWSSGHWGLWWAKSQICQLLDQGLSALRIGTLDIFTDFMFWDPPGTNSASLESGQPQQRSLLSSFFLQKGLRRSVAPWLPQHDYKGSFSSSDAAGDVNRATHARRGLQGPTPWAVCCSTAAHKEVGQVLFCAALLFPSGFWDTIPHIRVI